MTADERKSIQDTLNGMIGKKYIFDETDVVTVTDITIQGDIVTIDTDVWTDKFDMTGFDDWGGKFVHTRKKSELITGLEASIIEKADQIVAKDAEIAELKKQLMVMRNVVNSPSPLKPQPQTQPEAKQENNKHASVYPLIYGTLFEAADRIAHGSLSLEKSAEIREICKLVSDISEVQSKVISFSRKPVERRFEVKR